MNIYLTTTTTTAHHQQQQQQFIAVYSYKVSSAKLMVNSSEEGTHVLKCCKDTKNKHQPTCMRVKEEQNRIGNDNQTTN